MPQRRTKQKQSPDAKGPCQTRPVDGDECWCAAWRTTQQPMELQHGAVGPQTRLDYAASLLKFESWLEQREEKVVTHAEIDAAMCTRMENEFMKGIGRAQEKRLLSAWMDKHASFGRHGARTLPKTWRSLQGWHRLSLGRSRKPWVLRDRVQTGGARPTFYGTVGDDGALHLSNFPPIFPESDNRFDVATKSTLPMETLWPINRKSRRLSDVGASQ